MGALRGNQVSTSQVFWSDAIVPVENGRRSESNSSEMIISSINHDGQQIPGADISGSKNVTCQMDMRKSQTCSDIQNTIDAQEKGQGTTGGVQVPVNSEVVAYSTGKDPKQLALDKTWDLIQPGSVDIFAPGLYQHAAGHLVGNKHYLL